MKRFIVDFFVLLFISIIIYLGISYSYQRKLDLLKAEINNYQKQLLQKKLPILTLADISFVFDKYKELMSIKKTPLYFTANTQKLSINQWKVTVELDGGDDGAADAADLRLDFPEGLTVFDLKTGSAFPLYPRKVVADNYILLTGLASIDNNQMVFGKPNKIFAEFTVQTKDNQLNKKQITVNKEDTKIYLNGESVLDTGKSVNLIDLP